jgi:hypothetical protein
MRSEANLYRDRVDSRLFVVGSHSASLTLGPSFAHNLCWRCPNGSCEVIFDIHTSRPFQRCKEQLKERCFAFCYWVLKLQESWRTPNFHFWECEFHPHTCLKVGLRQVWRMSVMHLLGVHTRFERPTCLQWCVLSKQKKFEIKLTQKQCFVRCINQKTTTMVWSVFKQ